MIGRPITVFWHRLAKRFGVTVAELQERMDSRELGAWMAYEQIEPDALDVIVSILANIGAMIANMGSRSMKVKPADFLPKTFERKADVREMAQALKGMAQRGKRSNNHRRHSGAG